MCQLTATFLLKCRKTGVQTVAKSLYGHKFYLTREEANKNDPSLSFYKKKPQPIHPKGKNERKIRHWQLSKSNATSMRMYYLAQKLSMASDKAWPFKQKKMQPQPCPIRNKMSNTFFFVIRLRGQKLMVIGFALSWYFLIIKGFHSVCYSSLMKTYRTFLDWSKKHTHG